MYMVEEDSEVYTMFTVRSRQQREKSMTVDIFTNGQDTCASVLIISESTYKRNWSMWSTPTLSTSDIDLHTYTNLLGWDSVKTELGRAILDTGYIVPNTFGETLWPP